MEEWLNTLFAIFITIGAGWFAIVTTIIIEEDKQKERKNK